MVHNVQYNGLSFINNPHFRNEKGFLCLKEFSFFEVPTSASTEKYAIRHGEYVSPTLKKNRRIRMLFDILADTEEQRRTLLKKVQRGFAPEQNPSPFNENLWKKLTFQDINGDTWECDCQVIKGIELSDFGNQKRVGISVELITNSSDYRNSEVQTVTDGRNTRFGKRMSNSMGFGLEYEYYRDILNYQGVMDGPFTIRMQVTASNPVPNNKINIVHEWEGNWEALQIDNVDTLDLEVNDMIVINTDERRIILIKPSGFTDITGMITLGSQRPLLKIGDNILAVDTGASEQTLNIDYERNEVF